MPSPSYFDVQGLQPAYETPPPRKLTCQLPYGGRAGTGAAGTAGTPFLKGMALSVISTTIANEVRTLTLASTPSGTVTVTLIFASGPVIFTFAYNASLATVQAALNAAVPEWSGYCVVSGTPGSSYVFTFSGGYLAGSAIGGSWSATITSGTATWARTTAGSSICQLDEYNASNNNNVVEGFLRWDAYTTPGGAKYVPGQGIPVATGMPESQEYYETGIFNATDLVGLDTNAYTLGRLVKLAGGNLVELP